MMPLTKVKKKGQIGWKWGESGKAYFGPGAKAKARKQMRAILATGWTENAAPSQKKKRTVNPLKLDPTRSATLRRKFTAEIARRLNLLKRRVRKLVAEDDVFGMRDDAPSFVGNWNPGQPRDSHGRWSSGGGSSIGSRMREVSVLPMDTGGRMDIETAKDLQEKLSSLHDESPELQAVVRLLKAQTVLDVKADVVQAVVKSVAAGKDHLKDKTVTRKVEKYNSVIIGDQINEKKLDEWAEDAGDYLEALRQAPESTVGMYRGQKKSKTAPVVGQTIEFNGPVSMSQSQDVAAYYAGGELIRVAPGAKYLSVELLKGAAEGPEGGVYKHRQSRKGYENQPVYFGASMGTDEEVISSGKFRVSAVSEQTISYQDQITGKQKKKTMRVIDVEPLFGELTVENSFTVNQRWKFHTSQEKLTLFKTWLQQQLIDVFLGDETTTEDDWWAAYIREGYRKGAGRAFDDTRKPYARGYARDESTSDFYSGSKYEFLQSSFANPQRKEKVLLLASRTFTDLKGVTEQMATVMSRSLVDGFVQGKSPWDVAKDLEKSVDGIGRNRANVIARSEIIRAHAEGQLDAFDDLGVEEVGAAVEWATAEDDRVCPLCAALHGVVMKVNEARGLIPRHPQCRCAWLPANVGEDHAGQKRTKTSIGKAIDESVRREIPVRSDRTLEEQLELTKWAGADTDVDKNRPKSILDNYNPGQPRDSHGRWSSGGGGGGSPQQAAAILIVESESRFPSITGVFRHPTAYTGKDPDPSTEQAVNVDVSDLIPTQSIAKRDQVKYFFEGGTSNDMPVVIKDGERLFLIDGHSRVVADVAKGMNKVRVVQYDGI